MTNIDVKTIESREISKLIEQTLSNRVVIVTRHGKPTILCLLIPEEARDDDKSLKQFLAPIMDVIQ